MATNIRALSRLPTSVGRNHSRLAGAGDGRLSPSFAVLLLSGQHWFIDWAGRVVGDVLVTSLALLLFPVPCLPFHLLSLSLFCPVSSSVTPSNTKLHEDSKSKSSVSSSLVLFPGVRFMVLWEYAVRLPREPYTVLNSPTEVREDSQKLHGCSQVRR